MIGLDSNVLLRALIDDDAVQSRRAQKFLTQNCSEQQPGFINAIVLAEIYWVTRQLPNFDKNKFVELVSGLLDSASFRISDERAVLLALADLKVGKAGFADYLIVRLNEAAGAVPTFTFDKLASRHPCFETIPA